jgi:hypothetical protein
VAIEPEMRQISVAAALEPELAESRAGESAVAGICRTHPNFFFFRKMAQDKVY